VDKTVIEDMKKAVPEVRTVYVIIGQVSNLEYPKN